MEEQLKLCSVVFVKIFVIAGVKLIGGMSETVPDHMFCTKPCLRQCECWRASLCDQSWDGAWLEGIARQDHLG